MSGNRRLIVNADDLGRSPGINAGIERAYQTGIVSSTTLMVNLDWTDDALDVIARNPNLAVGLHINLCYGDPTATSEEVESLVDAGGQFVDWSRDQSHLSEINPLDIENEVISQIERFEALVGRSPTHLDSHKYLHAFPPFLEPVCDVARRFNLPVRSIDSVDRATFRQLGLTTPDAFVRRFHGLDGEGTTVDILIDIIANVATGWTELMCHPGYVDAQIMASSYRDEREQELVILCSPDALDAISSHGIELSTFTDLKIGRCSAQ